MVYSDLFVLQVIMRDYKAGTGDNVVVDDDAVIRRIEEMREDEKKKVLREESYSSSTVERPETPDYDDLNKRFENLLHLIEKRNPPEILEDNVFHDEVVPDGAVHYNCSKPPDILDFTTRDNLDLDLEEVNITLDGIEIVQNSSNQRTHDYTDDTGDLPDHLKEMVNKAISEMK